MLDSLPEDHPLRKEGADRLAPQDKGLTDVEKKLKEAGATNLKANPGDPYGSYGLLEDGTFGYFDPVSGELVKVQANSTAGRAIGAVFAGTPIPEQESQPAQESQPEQGFYYDVEFGQEEIAAALTALANQLGRNPTQAEINAYLANPPVPEILNFEEVEEVKSQDPTIRVVPSDREQMRGATFKQGAGRIPVNYYWQYH